MQYPPSTFLRLMLCMSSTLAIYHNQFAVHIPAGAESANTIARKHGLHFVGQIGDLDNHFLFESPRLRKRSVERCGEHEALLASEPDILWFQQQEEKRRVKRDAAAAGQQPPSIFNSIPDPLFSWQWFLDHGAKDGSDMNVKPAWELGYTGKKVVVTILDDGIQYNHPDLQQNYDPLASKDINDNDEDPMPQDNGDNKHGTRCAGEVAAVAFNEYCGVGVAYNASIGGVRMLDGVVNDAVEARALSLNPSHIDIYSASWGPEDDGKTVDGPGPLAKKAFINGISKGRDGKGSIFVWASGNGGHHTDNCNCDGYTNSVFTLSISSATQGGLKPWYLEECSSTLATTYSSGTPGQDASIATVDQDARLRKDKICTTAHTGTSASAPLAAGVCALALEANRNLTWRDMQHIVVATSNPQPLQNEDGWAVNAVGRKYSHKFGYGLLDAGRLVRLAASWQQAPPQHICETRVESPNQVLPKMAGMMVNVSMITDGCDNMLSKVRYLEHVQCRISLKYFPRGQLHILLRSPRGTKSYLLFTRPKDRQASGFEDWPFLSVHFWGEDPTGEWTLEISNPGSKEANADGQLKHWQLVLYGTEENPLQHQEGWSLTRPYQPSGDENKLTSSPDEEDVVGSAPFTPGNSAAIQVTDPTATLILTGCHPECRQGCYGPGPENCAACENFLLGGACLAACPPGYYPAISRTPVPGGRGHPDGRGRPGGMGECRPCGSACKECFGPGPAHCLSCPEPRLLLTDRAACVDYCPLGYAPSTDARRCEPCAGECGSCQPGDTLSTCLSCPPDLVLLDGRCRPSCPAGYYMLNNMTGLVCLPCHASCETCTGPLDTQCGKCMNGSYYFERRCVSYCPPGYYSQEKARECMACPPGCDSCPQSEGVCGECKKNWFLTNGECLPPDSRQCQPGMYNSGGTCLACHTSCKTCTGPKDRDCSSCYPDHRLHISTCVEVCPLRTRPALAVNFCLACPHACAACNGEKCSACISGYQLVEEEGECRTSCPVGMFPHQESVCGPCHLSCQDCFGPGSNHCLSCSQEKGLVLADGQCLSSCPESYVPSQPVLNTTSTSSSSMCTKCHSSCSTCTGPGPRNCSQCRPGDTLIGGYCSTCEPGFYLSPLRICLACHTSCGACTGPDPNQCSSCSEPLQYDSWSSTCVPCCTDQDRVPCCMCGTRGMCTSPARLTRSLMGPSSLGGILLGIAGIVGVVVSVIYVAHSVKRFRRRRRGSVRYRGRGSATRAEKYHQVPVQGDESPFLRDISSPSEEESEPEETQFQPAAS